MKIETKSDITQKVGGSYAVSNTIYGSFHDFSYHYKVIVISPRSNLLIKINSNSIYHLKRTGVPFVYNVVTNLRYGFGYDKQNINVRCG
jgi:hypothetical protein